MMLNRQKAVLLLLRRNSRPLHRTNLVKLLFLMSKETAVKDEPSMYDFVPYKFGPFSFALYHELESLSRDGHISFSEEQVALSSPGSWNPSLDAKSVPAVWKKAVDHVFLFYGAMTGTDLLRSVYRRYPWYATKSERTDLLPEDLPEASSTAPAVYTMGYQEKSIDSFADDLLRKGIRTVCDVRANPLSRKYGFSGKSMKTIVEKLGIEYRPFPELGIPSRMRVGNIDNFSSCQQLFDRYEAEILPTKKESVRRLAAVMQDGPTVTMCMEKDPQWCHRSRLATALSLECGLPVVHL